MYNNKNNSNNTIDQFSWFTYEYIIADLIGKGILICKFRYTKFNTSVLCIDKCQNTQQQQSMNNSNMSNSNSSSNNNIHENKIYCCIPIVDQKLNVVIQKNILLKYNLIIKQKEQEEE